MSARPLTLAFSIVVTDDQGTAPHDPRHRRQNLWALVEFWEQVKRGLRGRRTGSRITAMCDSITEEFKKKWMY